MESKILEQLVRMVLPGAIPDHFAIVKIETDEREIDAMSITIHLDERMNEDYLLARSENCSYICIYE